MRNCLTNDILIRQKDAVIILLYFVCEFYRGFLYFWSEQLCSTPQIKVAYKKRQQKLSLKRKKTMSFAFIFICI